MLRRVKGTKMKPAILFGMTASKGDVEYCDPPHTHTHTHTHFGAMLDAASTLHLNSFHRNVLNTGLTKAMVNNTQVDIRRYLGLQLSSTSLQVLRF